MELLYGWIKIRETERGDYVAEIYLLELGNSSEGVATTSSEEDTAKKDARKSDLLIDVKTILKSLEEIIKDLPYWSQVTFDIACEVADLFSRHVKIKTNRHLTTVLLRRRVSFK